MENKKYLPHSRKGMPFIDLWSFFYLFMVYAFTLVFDQANIVIFALYFVCAMPFVHHLDKYVCICFLLSTMSYYFMGADEGVWSLYTILAMMMLLRIFTRVRIVLPIKACLYLSWMVAAVIVSYNHSEFAYANGMFAMVYNIVIAWLIAITIKIDEDTIVTFLPKIKCFI